VAYRPQDQALYVQLADTLRDRITSGALPPGSVLPSETELMTEYGVSRPTARAAFTALRNQGLITVIHGKGSFVRRLDTLPTHTHPRTIAATPPPRARSGRRTTKTTPDQRWVYTDTDTTQWTVVGEPQRSRTDATPTLALALVVPQHAPLFVYDRVLADPTGRRVAHRVYLPLAICADVPALETDPFHAPGELYTLLGAHYGALHWTEHVQTRMPTPSEVTALGVPNNAPLLVTQRITHAIGGRPLALEETRLSGEDTQLTYTLTANTPNAHTDSTSLS
jgi:GntR family transcriptional regulator